MNKSIEILERTPVVLSSLLHALSDEWINCNEGDDSWSPFDIVGHLIHGDKSDWLVRIKIILSESDNKTFEPFDRIAQFRESKGKSILQLLTEFREIRSENLSELKNLNITSTDMEKVAIHPVFGEVTLSELISTWVVHDLNHISQIVRVMAKQNKELVGPWIEYLSILK